jgi:excisionase family DNA binding protein
MESHRFPITLTGAPRYPGVPGGFWFWLFRWSWGRVAHLWRMDTTRQSFGLEPLIGVEELAAYLGVPVQTVYDWRVSERAPRAYKVGKHVRFAVGDVQAWLSAQREDDDGHGGQRECNSPREDRPGNDQPHVLGVLGGGGRG